MTCDVSFAETSEKEVRNILKLCLRVPLRTSILIYLVPYMVSSENQHCFQNILYLISFSLDNLPYDFTNVLRRYENQVQL